MVSWVDFTRKKSASEDDVRGAHGSIVSGNAILAAFYERAALSFNGRKINKREVDVKILIIYGSRRYACSSIIIIRSIVN